MINKYSVTTSEQYEADLMGIGAHLRQERQRLKMTAKQLSEASGVPETTIYRLETMDSDPKLSNVMALAKALGCSLDQLVNGITQGSVLQKQLDKVHTLPRQAQAEIYGVIAKYAFVGEGIEQIHPDEVEETWGMADREAENFKKLN